MGKSRAKSPNTYLGAELGGTSNAYGRLNVDRFTDLQFQLHSVSFVQEDQQAGSGAGFGHCFCARGKYASGVFRSLPNEFFRMGLSINPVPTDPPRDAATEDEDLLDTNRLSVHGKLTNPAEMHTFNWLVGDVDHCA